jgi:site-specific recombinase XerD
MINELKTRKTTGLLKRIYEKIKGQIAEGKWFDISAESERTFNELMEKYMNEYSKLKKRSWKRDEVSLSHLLPFFGDQTLEGLTTGLISQYKSQRLKGGAKPATLNRDFSFMKHAFNFALIEWVWV